MTIAELLRARNEIDKLETLTKRDITEDELQPLLHNCRVAFQDYENELRTDYTKEKHPTYLNKEELETLSCLIAAAEIVYSVAFDFIKYKRPKKAVKYLKTARTLIIKAIAEVAEKLPRDEKLRLVKHATKRIKEG
jgi:hypothetical protein